MKAAPIVRYPIMEYACSSKQRPSSNTVQQKAVATPQALDSSRQMYCGPGSENGKLTFDYRVPTNVQLKVDTNGLKSYGELPSTSFASRPSSFNFSGPSPAFRSSFVDSPRASFSGSNPASASFHNDGRHFYRRNSQAMPGPSSSASTPLWNQPSTSTWVSGSTDLDSPASVKSPRKDLAVNQRKIIGEKIVKCKDQGSLIPFLPQCENATTTQLSILVRKHRNSANIPTKMKRVVFEDVEDEVEPQPPKKNVRSDDDPYATDYSDMEHDTHHEKWCRQLEGYELSIGGGIRERKNMLDELKESYKPHCSFEVIDPETSCARSRALLHHEPHKVVRRDYHLQITKPVPAPRTNFRYKAARRASVNSSIAEYFYLLSHVPAFAFRRRHDRAPHLNFNEIAEEQRRNGYFRVAEREKRLKRELEKQASGNAKYSDSSDYEDTDQDQSDTEYIPAKNYPEKVTSKKRRGRPPAEGKNNPLPISKVGRKGSMRSSKYHDFDDVVKDDSMMPRLLQVHDYAEIQVPTSHRVSQENIDEFKRWVKENPNGLEDAPDLYEQLRSLHEAKEAEERLRNECIAGGVRGRRMKDRERDIRELSSLSSDPPSNPLTPNL